MRGLLLLLLLCLPGVLSPAYAVEANHHFAGRAIFLSDQQRMIYLRTVIAKLRETTKAMKDVSELEQLGMPPREIERLQQAMEIKTKQLMDQALVLIKGL